MRAVVSLAPATLQIEPGSDATITVTISNTTSVVERYDVQVVGDLAPWATVDPPFLKLDKAPEPGSPREEIERERATGQVRVSFRIPRRSEPKAGTYTIGIFAKATATADASKTSECSITINPFVELEPEIVPQTSRGAFSGRHDLVVKNAGNAVAEVTTTASQVDRLLDFVVVPEMVGILPGDSKHVRIRAKPKDKAWTGPPTDVPFVVKTEDPMAGPINTSAALRLLAIIPSWIRPLAGLAVAAAALIVLGPPILRATGVLPTPSRAAVESPLVTATPFVPTPQPSAPPTPFIPTPSPNFEPMLMITGDNTWNGEAGITYNCTKPNPGCRDQVKFFLQLLLGSLRGGAEESKLAGFTADQQGTLTVVAVWDQPGMPYSGSGGSGTARQVALDLAPLLVEGGVPYVLIDRVDGPPVSFVAPEGYAWQIMDLLYTRPVGMPTPEPTFGPAPTYRVGFWDDAIVAGEFLEEIQFGT